MKAWWPLGPNEEPPPEVYEMDVDISGKKPKFIPRVVESEDVNAWMSAAERRELRIWKDFESLLKKLEPKNPLKVAFARKILPWLREEGQKHGYTWGG